jgi:hypothetical protein
LAQIHVSSGPPIRVLILRALAKYSSRPRFVGAPKTSARSLCCSRQTASNAAATSVGATAPPCRHKRRHHSAAVSPPPPLPPSGQASPPPPSPSGDHCHCQSTPSPSGEAVPVSKMDHGQAEMARHGVGTALPSSVPPPVASGLSGRTRPRPRCRMRSSFHVPRTQFLMFSFQVFFRVWFIFKICFHVLSFQFAYFHVKNPFCICCLSPAG